ncbi:MAG: hypothetical protein LIP11_00570 [Clostridiales bacterium]|nr:hypothetical protein [Clostridiales bacterium]
MPRKVKAAKPLIYVFCEGESEQAYTDYLKKMLDNAGLESPNDLYERGEWTWDKWREYMITLTQDV